MSENLLSSSELRKALGTFATGVTVVTAASQEGELAGLTVNSFTSVSLSPPLILWCLASTSESVDLFMSSEYFAVNILASDQHALSNHFATRQSNKFNNISSRSGLGNTPLIDGCVSWLQCKNIKSYEEGDHWIIIGEVLDLETTAREGLIFNQSNYGISLPLPAEENDSEIANKLINADSESYFSLLFQAIHSYQENFEKHQQKIIESDYEARVLAVLNHRKFTTVDDLCKVIKIPKSDIQLIIQELIVRGLVDVIDESGEKTLRLTQAGYEKSRSLLLLLQDHDEKINQLLGNEEYHGFRENLKKLIDWKY